MIKDILVNLSLGQQDDFPGEFAISVAAAFDAHLSGIAFAYRFPIGATVLMPSVIDEWDTERRREAERVRMNFEDRTRSVGISSDSRVISNDADAAAHIFGVTARQYDLSV